MVRCTLSVELGDDILIATSNRDVLRIVAIGERGSFPMPAAVGMDIAGAWRVGESATRLAVSHPDRLARSLPWGANSPPWQQIAGQRIPADELAARIVGEAVSRALLNLHDDLVALTVTTPDSCPAAFELAMRDRLVRLFPGVHIDLLPGVAAAAEFAALNHSLPIGASVLVIDWREGPPELAVLMSTPDGFDVVSAPQHSALQDTAPQDTRTLPTGHDAVAGASPVSPHAMRQALLGLSAAGQLEVDTVVLVGSAAVLPVVRQAVWDLLPLARVVPLTNDAIALGAAVHAAALLDEKQPISPAMALAEPPVIDDDVQFTVYRPRRVPAGQWERLLAFAHKTEEVLDNGRCINPVLQVAEEAAAVLGADAARYVAVARDTDTELPRGVSIRFVPEVSGIEFDPPVREFRWLRPVHREEFLFRASDALDGTVARGMLSVYVGTVLIADVSLSIKIDSRSGSSTAEPIATHPYQKIFPSYSHLDAAVVDNVELVASAIGFEFTRDVDRLRSGQVWSTELARYIREADIFQLYWSSNSMSSEFVRDEWRYALALGRPGFIRPVYWEQPRPASAERNLPPPELDRIHFSYLPVAGNRGQAQLHTAEAGALAPAPAQVPPGMPATSPQPQPAGLFPSESTANPAPSRRGRVLAGASAAVLAAAAAVVIGSTTITHRSTAGRGLLAAPTASPSSSARFTLPAATNLAESPTAAAGPSFVDSQRAVDSYVSDVNARDTFEARTLICAASRASFDANLAKPDSDFTYFWSAVSVGRISVFEDQVEHRGV